MRCTAQMIAAWCSTLACVTAAPRVSPAPAVLRQQVVQKDVEAIRLARNHLNEALSTRNLERYASYWTKDAVVMWASGSLRFGVDDNATRMAETFRDPHFSGRRTAEKIEVSNDTPAYASESGEWLWSVGLKTGAVGIYRGRYLIMWLKTEGQWKIRSELYVETSCSGDPGCN